MTDSGGGGRVPGGCQPTWREPVGCGHGSRWTPDPQAFLPLEGNSTTDFGRHEHSLPEDIGGRRGSETPRMPISAVGMGGGPVASQKHAVGAQRCEMRPAGAGRLSSPKSLVDISEVRGNAATRPLSVGAAEFLPLLDLGLEGRLGGGS